MQIASLEVQSAEARGITERALEEAKEQATLLQRRVDEQEAAFEKMKGELDAMKLKEGEKTAEDELQTIRFSITSSLRSDLVLTCAV